jgi:hypothetical protein
VCVQWRRSVTLDETCTLLADVQTLVDIPPRIQKLVCIACAHACAQTSSAVSSPYSAVMQLTSHRHMHLTLPAGGGRGLVGGRSAAAGGVQPAGTPGDVQGTHEAAACAPSTLSATLTHAVGMLVCMYMYNVVIGTCSSNAPEVLEIYIVAATVCSCRGSHKFMMALRCSTHFWQTCRSVRSGT